MGMDYSVKDGYANDLVSLFLLGGGALSLSTSLST